MMSDYADFKHANNTRKSYAAQWRKFQVYAEGEGRESLPADVDLVVKYLSYLADSNYKPSTISMARTAIDYYHLEDGYHAPGKAKLAKETMAGIVRAKGGAKGQKFGITQDVFNKVRDAVGDDRKHVEAVTAIAVMRDGMLRASELLALRVQDLRVEMDRTGRLTIKRSKTDQSGQGAVVYLSVGATDMVNRWVALTQRFGDHYLFGAKSRKMHRYSLARKIKRALFVAGIDPSGFSTHSCRIGMAQDLSAGNISDTQIAQAGRWSGTGQVINYTRNQAAGRGAVAQFYGGNNVAAIAH